MTTEIKLASKADEDLIQYIEFFEVESGTLEKRDSTRYIVNEKTKERVGEFLYLCLIEDSKNSSYAPMASDFVKQFDDFLQKFDQVWHSVAIHD